MGELIKIKNQVPYFRDFYFLTGAIEINGMKPVFNHVHSESGELVATEGRRLFILKNEKIVYPDGNYELLKRNKREILLHKTENEPWKFPNYKILFPEGWEQHKKLESVSIYKYEIFKTYLKIHKVLPEKYYLNLDYLKSLNSGSWDVYIPPDEDNKISGVIFTNSDKTKIAIIMPLINK